jgi:hypothetical protein
MLSLLGQEIFKNLGISVFLIKKPYQKPFCRGNNPTLSGVKNDGCKKITFVHGYFGVSEDA